MTDEQANHLNDDQEKYAGEPVAETVEPEYGFTPRPGSHEDGGWKPDEHPHGEPDPGPSIEEDPGARGPQARSALPRNEPVPPEIREVPRAEDEPRAGDREDDDPDES